MNDLGLYIHIPFCQHKCIYCDFFSITNKSRVNDYFEALSKELSGYKELLALSLVKTIFVGGGTPSLASADYFYSLFEKLSNYTAIDKYCEVTIEANPGTVDLQKLRDYLSVGFNRISFGIQSFDNRDLSFLTRIHSSQDASDSVIIAKEAGFNNISIDLIFNLPNQTRNVWLSNLNKAISLPVNHISTYSLIVEENTPLFEMVETGKIVVEGEEVDSELYMETISYLTDNQFKQYEVSNFCKDGFECKHNLGYWQYKNYLGLGCSSHSFAEFMDHNSQNNFKKRWWNISDVDQYISRLSNNESVVANSETLSLAQQTDEYIMLGLRSMGINLDDFKRRFGYCFFEAKSVLLNRYSADGYILIDKSFISLTPKGYSVADKIILELGSWRKC